MDCSWRDEVSDQNVDYMLEELEDGVVFKREMFAGGFRGLAAPVQPQARVIKKGKRKCNAKLLAPKMDSGESSSSKKRKLRCHRSKSSSVDHNAKMLAAVSSQIRAGVKEAQSAVYANISSDIKEMEERLQQSFKSNILSVVSEYLNAEAAANNAQQSVVSVGVQTGNPKNPNPVQVAEKIPSPKVCLYGLICYS